MVVQAFEVTSAQLVFTLVHTILAVTTIHVASVSDIFSICKQWSGLKGCLCGADSHMPTHSISACSKPLPSFHLSQEYMYIVIIPSMIGVHRHYSISN